MLIRRKLIRTKATELLNTCGITKPAVPVEKIAEHLGLSVVLQSADDELSGFLVRNVHQGTAIIGVNKEHHANRQRFTIGHELGHFLLHEGEELHIDKAHSGYEIKLRYGHSSEDSDVDEKEANLFSAELLMPHQFLEADLEKHAPLCLSDDDRLSQLAKRYKVSTQALTLRLMYLGYVAQ